MPSPKTNQPNRPQKSKFWALVELLFQGLWKHRLLYLALILLVMCSTSFVMYHLKARTAKMMIALNYEEATRGLYPNNTRFNISLIKSDDVLDRAIAKAGLEGQVTAQDMAENITAWASNVNGMQLLPTPRAIRSPPPTPSPTKRTTRSAPASRPEICSA